MPHKHTRPRTSPSSHDLPPTSLARPLPVSKSPQNPAPHRPHKQNPQDDTPRAFTRLMTYASTGRKTPRGLDDGSSAHSQSRKRKRDSSQDMDASTAVPKILPGERMGDYAARVDMALPVRGLVGKGRGERQSRLEKRMQRMQREWREVDRRLRERGEEEEEVEEDGGGAGKSAKKGKKRKGKGKGGVEDDEDPWAVVAKNRKREQEEKEKEKEGRGGGLVGLHDVVLAPPKFERKVKVGDVVKKGGLKRQVEVSEARREVVEGYRRMMRERREGQAGV
ncbi:MAG: hypothetical protein LQ338_006824 [Usnochroma carphineum]|nr:MAG: hypothetical protein LQ338_006824 [Usnochroma carphineum]